MLKPSELVAKGWCQHKSATNKAGELCWSRDEKATNWCILGAIWAVYGLSSDQRNIITYLKNKLNVKTRPDLSAWNDAPERTQAEVVALLQSVGE